MNKTSDSGIKAVVGLLTLILLLNIVTVIMLDGLRDTLEQIKDGIEESMTVPETEDDVTIDSPTTPDTKPSIPTVAETIPQTKPTEPTIPILPTPTIPTTPEPTEAPKPTEPEIDPYELELLACVIYQEAGWDLSCDDCRRRVADVVLNRMEDPRFPSTMHEVLTQKNQYGSYYWTGVVWPERSNSEYEKHAVERAYRIAREVLSGKHSELYGKGYVWQASFIQGKNNIYCCGTYFGR